jgi:LEA14-like dessication related protein
MKANKVLLVAGAGIAGVAVLRYVYRNILLANQWDYSVDGFVLTQLTPQAQGVVYLTFINKSNFKAVIKDIDVKVFSNNAQIGAITEPNETNIEPNGKSKVKLTLSFDPKAVLNNWRSLIASALTTKDIPLDFVGTFKVKTLFGFTAIPIRFSTTGKELKSLYDTYYG